MADLSAIVATCQGTWLETAGEDHLQINRQEETDLQRINNQTGLRGSTIPEDNSNLTEMPKMIIPVTLIDGVPSTSVLLLKVL